MIALAPIPVYSQPDDRKGHEITVAPSFASTYMFRGMRLGGTSFQPTVEYSKGPLTLGLFGNMPVSDRFSGDPVDPEIDIYASYDWEVVPEVFTIRPGIAVYTYPNADKEEGFYKAQYEPYVCFAYTVHDMTLSLNLYYDLVLKGPTYEIEADYAIPIKPFNFDIELSALIGKYDWSDYEAETPSKIRAYGTYWQIGAAVPFEFSSRSKFIVGWYYAKGANSYIQVKNEFKEPNLDAVGRGVFNVSYSRTF